MYYGVCYYPEHWPEERWPVDAQFMREAGFNIARIGEFAWSKLERRPGQYDFDWLDRSIATLAGEGIRVILGTPTATPPKWLMDQHPDIYMRDEKGQIRGFGNRRHYCFNNANYHRHADRIVTMLAERYGSHPNVIAWQIDNEFGCNGTTRCFCDACRTAFHRWLERKYGDVDAMNESWGTVFWSQTYNAWEEVTLPGYAPFHLHNPGLVIDYRRFASDAVVAFQQRQIDILRNHAPNQRITHNLMGAFNEIDGKALAEKLDFVSWDNYPNLYFADATDPSKAALQHDLTRGLKGEPFWVMEHQSGAPGGDILFQTPKPGELRRWAFQSVARGADAILYFRWRTCLFGAEQFWHGILPHDGQPNRRYDEARRTGEEMRRIYDVFSGSNAGAQAAIIRSYDNEWATEIQPLLPNYSYMDHLHMYYRFFYEHGIPVDIVADDTDFSHYKLVVFPHYMMAKPETAERVYAFVRAGGVAVFDYRAGSKRWDNRMTAEPLPGPFRKLLGLRIVDYGTLRPKERVPLRLVEGEEAQEPLTGEGRLWYDVCEPEGAEPLARYEGDYFAGTPAATRNRYGGGAAYYIATEPDARTLDALLRRVAAEAGVEAVGGVRADDGVEVARRAAPRGAVVFAINHADGPRVVALQREMYDLLAESVRPAGEYVLQVNEVLALQDNVAGEPAERGGISEVTNSDLCGCEGSGSIS